MSRGEALATANRLMRHGQQYPDALSSTFTNMQRTYAPFTSLPEHDPRQKKDRTCPTRSHRPSRRTFQRLHKLVCGRYWAKKNGFVSSHKMSFVRVSSSVKKMSGQKRPPQASTSSPQRPTTVAQLRTTCFSVHALLLILFAVGTLYMCPCRLSELRIPVYADLCCIADHSRTVISPTHSHDTTAGIQQQAYTPYDTRTQHSPAVTAVTAVSRRRDVPFSSHDFHAPLPSTSHRRLSRIAFSPNMTSVSPDSLYEDACITVRDIPRWPSCQLP